MARIGDTLTRPLLVRLPGTESAEGRAGGAELLRAPARCAAVALLAAMMAAGVTLAVVGAVAAEGERFEGLGTLGTELGAALWFASAVAAGSRRGATVGRGLLLVLTFVAGAALIVSALALGWRGAALALAMEFGVGMLAVPIIDVVLIGALHQRLDDFGRRGPGGPVVISLSRRGRLAAAEYGGGGSSP